MTTLAQKLQAAEIRRKALEEEKINKLVEHHKAVETMKESRWVTFVCRVSMFEIIPNPPIFIQPSARVSQQDQH